ncbi:MAG: cyclase family protein [Bryobacteraceae bacterium]|jgi:arylformamidase
MTNKWIDVSVPLHNGMVHWPGDEPFNREVPVQIAKGDPCNVSKITCTVHIGTHMDAPHHFFDNGAGIETMPLEAAMGPARVIRLGDPDLIRIAELQPHNIQRGERVILKTRNSDESWWATPEFKKKFVHIPADTAAYLASTGVQTVGVDYLSVGGFNTDGPETHRAMLGAGIWIIEGLVLGAIEPGNYDLICLPLKITGSDGAPARAILRPRP